MAGLWRHSPTLALGLAAGRPYSLVNCLSGLALDVFESATAPGLHLTQWPYEGRTTQSWRAVGAGNGAFVLINQGSALLMRATSEWGGAKVDQWIPTGTADEQWLVVPVM